MHPSERDLTPWLFRDDYIPASAVVSRSPKAPAPWPWGPANSRDVISATLPVDPVVAELERMHARWGDINAAGVVFSEARAHLWTIESLAAADEFLTQDAAQASNMRMLDADAPKTAAPAPAAADPLDGVREAIETALAATVCDRRSELISQRADYVLTEVRKLLATRLTP